MNEPISSHELLLQGVTAAKAGDRGRARVLLTQAAELDPHVELTWLWLAWVARTKDEAIERLERALTINPFNRHARAWIVKIRARARFESTVQPRLGSRSRSQARADTDPRTPRPVPGVTSWRCPICDQSSIGRPVRCVRCRSVQSIADLWAFFEDAEVDFELLHSAVERVQSDATQEPAWRHRTLGLALLNLRRFRQALLHLSAAAALAPQDADLGRIAYELMCRLNRTQSQPSRCRHRA